MRYFIDLRGTVQNTADIKAPADMCDIMLRRGYTAIPFQRPRKGSRLGVVIHAKNWSRVYRTVKPGDLLVYQYPLLLGSHFCVRMLSRLRENCKVKVVLLIHDVDSIRGMNQESNAWMEMVFEHADDLICHNDRMKEWLIAHGVHDEIVPLGVFDYLVPENGEDGYPRKGEDHPATGSTVVIAGNLSPEKSPYIGKLLRMKRRVGVHLYGPNFVPEEDFRNYEYFGSFPPEKLTERLQAMIPAPREAESAEKASGAACFGLVWDGDSLEECSGMTGRYLRYNNPHKASLYIASGLPVIIWKQAALADYIERNQLGLTISSLEEMDGRIDSLSKDEYEQILKNVRKESERLRSGYYLNRALDQIEAGKK